MAEIVDTIEVPKADICDEIVDRDMEDRTNQEFRSDSQTSIQQKPEGLAENKGDLPLTPPLSATHELDTALPNDLQQVHSNDFEPVGFAEESVMEILPRETEKRGRSSEDTTDDPAPSNKRHCTYMAALERLKKFGGSEAAMAAFDESLETTKQQKMHRSSLPSPPQNWRRLTKHLYKDKHREFCTSLGLVDCTQEIYNLREADA